MKIHIREVENMLDEIERDELIHPIPACYFNRDKEHFHPEGTCIYCDWERQAKGKSWDHPAFIEWWEYRPIWEDCIKATENAID